MLFCFRFCCCIRQTDFALIGKIFDLQLKANLENLSELIPFGSDFRWYFKIKCTNCNESYEQFVYLCEEERVPLKGSKSSTNLLIKCKFCGRENSADIVPGSLNAYTEDFSEKFHTILQLQCRGLEPLEFSQRVGWRAVAVGSNTQFNNIDLRQSDWASYDDNGDQCVGIYDVTSKFIRSK